MNKVIILKGLPASGKTTWAREMLDKYPNEYKRINKDNLRSMIDDNQWSKVNEKLILKVRDRLINLFMEQKVPNIIIDDTNLNPIHEEQIRKLVKNWNDFLLLRSDSSNYIPYEVEVKFFGTPVEECIERDKARPNSVGKEVILSMWSKFIVKVSPPEYNLNLPDCIICDLDGTLALLGDRNPYDASTCEEDEVNLPVFKALWSWIGYMFDGTYNNQNGKVIFVSGREDKYREQTIRWLHRECDLFDKWFELYMRPTDDHRSDEIIKEEIYHSNIENNFNVMGIYDDRPRVCRVWRYRLGLPVFQLNDVEF